jgi:hypothetical protein
MKEPNNLLGEKADSRSSGQHIRRFLWNRKSITVRVRITRPFQGNKPMGAGAVDWDMGPISAFGLRTRNT